MKHKIITAFLLLALLVSMSLCVTAQEALVIDNAGLLTQQQASQLQEKLDTIGKNYNAQLIVYTVSSMNGGDIDTYVEYLYDSNDWGCGKNRDGVLLLVSMAPRQYRILSNGYAGTAISVDTIDTIGDKIVPYLSDGDYAKAFSVFADQCDYYLNGYLNGFPFDAGFNLVICLIIGLVIGLITTAILKAQLKTVRQQNQANEYVKAGSLNVTTSYEYFLHHHVSRSQRSSDSSSSRSSGSSRSVGGGSF
jgi:uncharacterized protein